MSPAVVQTEKSMEKKIHIGKVCILCVFCVMFSNSPYINNYRNENNTNDIPT